MDYRINYNFSRVYNDLLKTNKRTYIAHQMGYSSTAQLENSLTGKALISTKAIMNLTKNFKVSPTYIFTGQGAMYISTEAVQTTLQF